MKKNKQKKPQPVTKTLKAHGKKVSSGSLKYYWFLAGILFISFIVYLPIFKNGLLDWDDNFYIKDNPLVHSINLKDIFSSYVMGNYHPITILMLAIEYQFFGLSPAAYHAINLVFHLLNVLLVFYAIRAVSNHNRVALVASFLFGIHPLHVESVAWAAELKDQLYTFFFLGSYIFYLKYLADSRRKFYGISLILFLFSLLSKAMAASLPVVLLLTDYFKGRKINEKTLLEKLPFFLLSIVFGIISIFAQKSGGATEVVDFPFPLRVVFACYGFMTYLFQFVIPLNLSAYYPYPIKNGESLPTLYYLYPILVAGLIAFVIYSLRFTKKIFFGIGFFSVTVFLVLQLFPVGGAIMADRYSYVPSIGLCYLVAEGLQYLLDKKIKWLGISLVGGFAVFFCIQTYNRSIVWRDDLDLWNDALSKYTNIPIAYNNRGRVYLLQGQNDTAIKDFDKAIELNPEYVKAYANRGVALMNINKNDEALKDLNKAIELMPGLETSYISRGNVLKNKNRLDEALKDYNKAIELNPDFPEAYYSKGLFFMSQGKFNEAIENYNKAIGLNENYIESYLNRGNIFRDSNKYEEALQDYETVIKLNPGFVLAYFNRGNLFMNRKMYDRALNDFDRAIELQPNYIKAYMNKASVLTTVKRYEEAIQTYSKAIEIKNDYAELYYGRALTNFYSGKKEMACMDIKKAVNLGYQQATSILPQICN